MSEECYLTPLPKHRPGAVHQARHRLERSQARLLTRRLEHGHERLCYVRSQDVLVVSVGARVVGVGEAGEEEEVDVEGEGGEFTVVVVEMGQPPSFAFIRREGKKTCLFRFWQVRKKQNVGV